MFPFQLVNQILVQHVKFLLKNRDYLYVSYLAVKTHTDRNYASLNRRKCNNINRNCINVTLVVVISILFGVLMTLVAFKYFGMR